MSDYSFINIQNDLNKARRDTLLILHNTVQSLQLEVRQKLWQHKLRAC